MERRKKEEKNPLHKEYGLWSNLCFMLRRAVYYEKAFLWLVPIGVLVAPVMQYLWTFISKLVIDLITGETETEQLLLLMAGCTVVQVISTTLNTYYNSEYWWRCINVRLRMMNDDKNYKAMQIGFEHLEDTDVMDCYNKAGNACNNNNNGLEGMLRDSVGFLQSLAIVVCGIIILGTMNPWITLVMLLFAVISFAVNDRTNAKSKKTVWDELSTLWRKMYYMQDRTTSFEMAKDIRMFHLKDWLLKKYHELNETRLEYEKKNARLWFVAGLVSNVCGILAHFVVYIWLLYTLSKGEMTIGNFTLYTASTGTLFGYFNSLLGGMGNLFARSREIDDFRSFLDFDGGDKEEGIPVPECDSYEFRFENVSFRYPKAEKYALKNLNLTLQAGERLAVVGLNGAGKSTFIKLLLRLYEPTEGTIYLNDTDIRSYSKKSYYRIFAPVFQEVRLFAFPLAENISMNTPQETDKKLAKECLVAAGFEEKLLELEQGIDTEVLKVIHDDGVDFSGGEKQKLALARALYKKAPVVVLDEPTAALDALAEYELYQNFDRLIGGKTAVYISHRLSSTRFCNHVAMFKDGEMVEYGTHDTLLEQKGAYAEMFEVQAQYYTEEAEKEVAAC